MEDLEDFFGTMGDGLGSGEHSAAAGAPSQPFRRTAAQPPQFDPRYSGVRRAPVRRMPPPPPEPEYDDPPFAEQPAESGLPLHEPRTEAEARLHRARYFETLLANSIFPQANSQGQWVEQRLRAWAENELATLLGMRPPNDLAPFTREQIVALRSLANKLLGGVKEKIETPREPEQEKSLPPAPRAPPPPRAPAAPVRRRPLIKSQQPEPEPEVELPPPPPPPPAPRSQSLIPARKPVAKPRRAAKAPEAQARPSRAPQSRRTAPKSQIDEDSLNDGEIVEVGSKKFKIIIGSDEKGDRKVIYQDVTPTPVVEAAPPTPMPDAVQMEHVTAMAAATQVEKAMRGSRALQRATQAAINS